MDRQAFRNRMQQLKQYREQNPGKTYFDFKAYADGGSTDQRTDHPISKPSYPVPKMILQDRLIDLGGSPSEDITYEERYKRGKKERTLQDWKSLLHGINSTFGTAASLASLIYGGGWSLTRLLNGNKSSTIGQTLSKYVLPSNTIDTAADIAAFVEEPNTETGAEIIGGILLGKERDFSKTTRQVAELAQQVQNANNTFADGGEIPPNNKPIIPEEPQPYKGNTMYFNRDMIKTPEDIPNSVVLHEMGHLVDGATGMNNEFLRKLGDKSKFIPFNQARTMYPNMTREMYNNILQGTEIKSYMNQFRNYLQEKGKLNKGNYTGSYKNLRQELLEAPRESFNNIKAIFNLYRSPKLFNKDFNMIPVVSTDSNRDMV